MFRFVFCQFFYISAAISFGRSVSDVSGAVAAAHLGKVFVSLFYSDRRQVDESSPGKYYRLRALHTAAFEICFTYSFIIIINTNGTRAVVSGCVGMRASANAVATHAPYIC